MGLHSPSVCLLLWASGVDVAQRWGVSPSSDCCRLKALQNCDDIRASGPVTRRCFGSAWGVATGACRWFSTFSHTAAWWSCAAFWRGWLCAGWRAPVVFGVVKLAKIKETPVSERKDIFKVYWWMFQRCSLFLLTLTAGPQIDIYSFCTGLRLKKIQSDACF